MGSPLYIKIAELAQKGLNAAEIEATLGCTRGTVYQGVGWARKRGFSIPPRLPHSPYRVENVLRRAMFDGELTRRLQPHAVARGMSVAGLGCAILQKVAEDDLVDAVLDDMEISDD